MLRPLRLPTLLLALPALLATACLSQGTRITPIASAKKISSEKDFIGGPNATAGYGDFLLRNERIRVVIQRAGAPARTPFTLGGGLIDVDRMRFPGEPGGDRFGGMTILLNGVRTVKAKNVFVLEDGSATGYAVVRAEGDDAPYQGTTLRRFAQAVSREVSPEFDAEKPLDVLVKTDYVLKPGANYLEIRTTFINRRSVPTQVVFGDVLDYGSTTPYISEGRGFALPGVDDDYAAPAKLAIFEGDGVSYGYRVGRQLFVDVIADDKANTSRADTLIAAVIPFDGLLGLFHNFGTLSTVVNPVGDDNEQRLIEVPGAGSATVTRYVIVGQGDGGGVMDGVNDIEQEILGYDIEDRSSEMVAGTVTVKGSGEPVVGADVAVFAAGVPIAHLKTDANGQFNSVLPPGGYQLAANVKGHPYEKKNAEFLYVKLGEKDGVTHTVDLTVEPAARLRLFVKDTTPLFDPEGNYAPSELPLAARVRIERQGGDPSPARMNLEKFSAFPFRPTESNVVTIDPSGQLSLDVEPGTYTITGFHGPAYSLYRTTGTFEAGTRNDRVIELARTVAAGGALAADLAGASYLARGRLSPADRIIAAYADGIEFLVMADAGARTEVLDVLDALDDEFKSGKEAKYDVSKHIGVTPGERVVTSGYGSFTAWPLYSSPAAPLGGQLAWDNGDKAALTPAEIIAGLLGLPADKDYVEGTGRDEVAPPITAVDMPFGAPGGAELGYFDAIDLSIDWSKPLESGPLFVGEKALAPAEVGLAGKAPADLLATNWQALNIAPSNDESTLWLGINAWFALLNAGLNPDKRGLPQIVAVGNPVGGETEAPTGGFRNLVFSGVASPKSFLTDQIKAVTQFDTDLATQRANVVTNGPYVNVRLMSLSTASEVAGYGGMIDAGQDATVELYVAVTTPCWAPVDRIEIFMNAQVTEPVIVNDAIQAMPAPVSTFTAFDSRTVVTDVPNLPAAAACRADGAGPGRIEIEHTVVLPVSRDAWVVVVASGANATAAGMRPIAITNPVYVDQDGGGTFTPLCPADCPNSGKSRLGWYTPARADAFR